MHTCAYVYTHVKSEMSLHSYVPIYVHMGKNVHTGVHVFLYAHMHVCGFRSMCRCECLCIFVCVWQNHHVRNLNVRNQKSELVYLPGSGAACALTRFPCFLLSGPASDHPSVTTATGPTVFNGKDSPKQPQLAKSSLSAVPRPSALGSAAGPGGARALLYSGPGPEGTWVQDWGPGGSSV